MRGELVKALTVSQPRALHTEELKITILCEIPDVRASSLSSVIGHR